jgi:hypothetical protein
MSKKSSESIKALPKKWLIGLVAFNFLYMGLVYYYTEHAFGWVKGDLADGSIDRFDVIAIIQFLLFAITLDQIVKRASVDFNAASKEKKIPHLIVQVLTIFIFGLVGFIGFILLYDREFTNLIAATSGLGVGLVLLLKDRIADIMGSLELQTDGLVSKGDYIDLIEDGKKECYQVIEMDQRRITLKSVADDYERRISNKKFLSLEFINLTKQGKHRGSMRKISVELPSERYADKVVEIFSLALEKVTSINESYTKLYFCGAVSIKDGAVEYVLEYECKPELRVNDTNSEVLLTALRFLKAASLDLTDHKKDVKIVSQAIKNTTRLLSLYEMSILKVLSLDDIINIGKKVGAVNMNAGAHLIKKNENADSMFLISEGALEVSILNKEGNPTVVATLWPGDCVGEMSLLTGAPRSADVYVKHKAVLVEIKKEDLAPILESNQELIELMSKLLAERMTQNENFLNSEDKEKKLEEAKKSIASKILGFFFKKPS